MRVVTQIGEQRTSRTKLGLIGLLFFFPILIPVSNHLRQTVLMTDPYWRYQGALLAKSIKTSGHIVMSPYSADSLLVSWVNSFSDNFAGPLVVVIVSYITGLPTHIVQNLPLFTPALILSTALLASIISKSKEVFVISILLGISFKYTLSHITFPAHRGGFAWAVFFTIIAAWTLTRRKPDRTQFYLSIPLIVVFPMTAHTLPIASLLFFTTIFVLSYISYEKVIGWRIYTICVVFITTFTSILFEWLGLVIFKFSIAISAMSVNSLNDFFSFGTSSAIFTELRQLMVTFNPPQIYSGAVIYSNIIAVVLVGALFAYRVYQKWVQRTIMNLSILDVLLLSFGIQGFSYMIILPLFAPSGGISPFILGLLVTPLFGSITIYLLFRKIRSVHLYRDRNIRYLATYCVILIIIIAPAFGVLTYKPYVNSQEMFSTTESNVAQIQFTKTYIKIDSKVFSDINTLSMLYAFKSELRSYVPPPGSPAYAEKSKAKALIRYYYSNPSAVANKVDFYILTPQMQNLGMFHLGSISTKPNPDISDQLGDKWGKIYDNGEGEIYAVG